MNNQELQVLVESVSRILMLVPHDADDAVPDMAMYHLGKAVGALSMALDELRKPEEKV